jgi:hypothetical protein
LFVNVTIPLDEPIDGVRDGEWTTAFCGKNVLAVGELPLQLP